jgi:hypothetical protein
MPPSAEEPLTNGLYQESSSNGANGHSPGNGVHPDTYKSAKLNDQYAYMPRKHRVITIGAGFSGLLMAHKFQHRFPEMQQFVEHTIFEGRSELGGTW